MRKITLTESQLHKLIKESITKILKEGYSHPVTYTNFDDYVEIDTDITYSDKNLVNFFNELFDTEDDESVEKYLTVKCHINIDGYCEYIPGSYDVPDDQSEDFTTYEISIDTDGRFKEIMPEELYKIFINDIRNYIEENDSDYINFDSCEPDGYDEWRDTRF